jgi:hypothetical protein
VDFYAYKHIYGDGMDAQRECFQFLLVTNLKKQQNRHACLYPSLNNLYLKRKLRKHLWNERKFDKLEARALELMLLMLFQFLTIVVNINNFYLITELWVIFLCDHCIYKMVYVLFCVICIIMFFFWLFLLITITIT